MAEAMNVPPTRSTLLRMRTELGQARHGHDLLERKREVLTRELLVMADDAERTETEVQQRFAAAYQALLEVRLRMGADRLRWASLAQTAELHPQLQLHTIMGVTVPLVEIEVTPLPLSYGLGDTSAALDEARARWLDVADLLGHWVETTTTIWRLAQELQKTQRRVNALEHILIPRYEATVAHIVQVLEEQEREAFVHAKSVKALQHDAEEEVSHD